MLAAALLLGLLAGAALTQSRTPNRRPARSPVQQEFSGDMPMRRYINPPVRGAAPFSDAVLVDNTLYLSGRFGIDPRTGQVPGNLELEIRLLMEGVRLTLAQAGMTMDDLVSVQVFCSDLALYDQFNNIYRLYFRSAPARAFIGSGPLLRGAHFMIQGIAVRQTPLVQQ
jgi:enamine deaminase RidA (YjgF/YER057c/UK114 family)